MVVLSKIYTKTGDKGETALSDGSRVPKYSPRVDAYGIIDELNATVGLARLYAQAELSLALARVSNDLFDLGADLATPKRNDELSSSPSTALRIIESQTTRLEQEIDQCNSLLNPLKSFILPGGTALSAHLHLCRTICRRAERSIVALAKHQSVNPEAIRYINRLSDWFFVMGRIANNNGQDDILWEPGMTRPK